MDKTDTRLVDEILAKFRLLNHTPRDGTYTILAAFALSSSDPNPRTHIIALATGCKCLPKDRLPEQGDALHDSHAEVLARRSARRWFLDEIGRYVVRGGESDWLTRDTGGKFRLGHGVCMIMYTSTPPYRITRARGQGGDASMSFLASYQDEAMARMKDATVYAPLPKDAACRGRDNYALLGVLRTKPGRSDSPPTSSMSCSDKIARWNVVGIQGALGSAFLHPIYVSKIIIGEVPERLQRDVIADCERAFWARLSDVSALSHPFHVHRPQVVFTSIPFEFSKLSVSLCGTARSFNESLCWVADAFFPHEILINGLKRGVPPKHRSKTIFRSQLSKASVFKTYCDTVCLLCCDGSSSEGLRYPTNSREGGPFSGWVTSGKLWENFAVTPPDVATSKGYKSKRLIEMPNKDNSTS